MKQLLVIFILFCCSTIKAQVVNSTDIGVQSKTKFTQQGQPIGVYLHMEYNDTFGYIVFKTKQGGEFRIIAPACDGIQYLDITQIGALAIGSPVTDGTPGSILYVDDDGLLNNTNKFSGLGLPYSLTYEQGSDFQFTLPAGKRLESIFISVLDGSGETSEVKIGTTEGGADIVARRTIDNRINDINIGKTLDYLNDKIIYVNNITSDGGGATIVTFKFRIW